MTPELTPDQKEWVIRSVFAAIGAVAHWLVRRLTPKKKK